MCADKSMALVQPPHPYEKLHISPLTITVMGGSHGDKLIKARWARLQSHSRCESSKAQLEVDREQEPVKYKAVLRVRVVSLFPY